MNDWNILVMSRNNSRGQVGPGGGGGGIPSVRVQMETPQPNADVRLPALSAQRSIITNNGKSTQNGSPFVTPRAPGPDLGNLGFQCFGVAPKPQQTPRAQGFGHHNAAAFLNPTHSQQLNLPNSRLETSTPTPSDISTISARNVHTPLSMISGQGSDRNLHTPISHVDRQFLEPNAPLKGWNPYSALPNVQNGKDSDNMSISDKNSIAERPHHASWHTHGVVPSSATTRYQTSSSGTNSLSPHNLPMDMSPTGSTALGSNFTNSPRHSAHIHSRAQKRAHSLSPIGDGMDFTKLIRASPTSLACINSAAVNAGAPPQVPQNMANCGHFGHLIARSPQSGSANSGHRMGFSQLKSEPGFEVSDIQDYFQDIVSNQMVMHQNEVPYWEQKAYADIQQFGRPQFSLPPENTVQPPGVNGNMSGYSHNMNVNNMSQNLNLMNMNDGMRPPPSYDQAINQHPAGMINGQQQFSAMQPQANNMNLNNMNNLNNLNNNLSTMHMNNESEFIEDEADENGEKQHTCRWVDCNVIFKEQEELVRHLEKSHIDQRKGEDFTCYWASCQRQEK
ncbi:GLIS3-like protein [Mya arenaria]|uniref:GLIS3-like protein n=1 Tax=Mya arenaria TaxID=6604 RepID=A0ABY7FTT3_MYAAR|nr:GLIS3-like protein [Mya arenaria]